MLGFIGTVNALYLYHRQTKHFLGAEKRSDNPYLSVVPVKNIADALDFRIGEGGAALAPENPENISGITSGASKLGIYLAHPTSSNSFDVYTNVFRDGNRLVLYPHNRSEAQIFFPTVLPDYGIVLAWRGGKCVVYNAAARVFESGPCTNLGSSSFDFYMETPPKGREIHEEIYNLRSPNDPDYTDTDFINYNTGSSSFFSSPAEKEALRMNFKRAPGADESSHDNEYYSSYRKPTYRNRYDRYSDSSDIDDRRRSLKYGSQPRSYKSHRGHSHA